MTQPPISRGFRGRGPESRAANVRYGSLADISERIRDVRFTPESGHAQRQRVDVRYVPETDIQGESLAAITDLRM